MTREPINERAMTDAERQKLRRIRIKERGLEQYLVKGKGGYFDEKIRIALAVENLVHCGEMDENFKIKLIDEAIEVLPPKSLSDRAYIKKIITEFLKSKQ